MPEGVDRFGIRNLEYDLVTTLSNLLQSTEALEKYAADAERAGDGECQTLFHTIRDSNKNHVEQLRKALARHLNSDSG